jgi:hypothetical protein
MKRNTSKFLLALGLCLFLLSTASVYAANSKDQVQIKDTGQSKPANTSKPKAGETINWQAISSGGIILSSSTGYQMSSTVGQTGIGNSSTVAHEIGHGFWPNPFGSGSCCVGQTGDANCAGGDEPDISDIVRVIDYLYLSKDPLCCLEEADATGNGGEPDVSDIVRLIDYLYLETHTPPAPCP